jgi:hypothetical protein
MTNLVHLTDLELQGLKSITHSDFYENGKESVVWDYSVYDICPFSGKTRSGVFSSLVQKGLVNIQEAETKFIKDKDGNKILNIFWSKDGLNFGTINITTEGYKLLDNLNLIDEDGSFIK